MAMQKPKLGNRRMSLVDMMALPTSKSGDDDEKPHLYHAAKTVDFAHKWSKGFKLARMFPRFYEPSVAASLETKSTGPKRHGMMFHIPTDNTYKMEPDVKFQPHKVEEVMRIILEEDLTDKAYSARDSQNVCKALTVKIRKAVKELNFSRYKIIVHVTIGQLKRQSFQSASRFLWDHKTDDHASANFKNDTLFCTATVFGVYYE